MPKKTPTTADYRAWDASRTRSERLSVRLTAEEKNALMEAADAAGLTIGEWIGDRARKEAKSNQ